MKQRDDFRRHRNEEGGESHRRPRRPNTKPDRRRPTTSQPKICVITVEQARAEGIPAWQLRNAANWNRHTASSLSERRAEGLELEIERDKQRMLAQAEALDAVARQL